MDAVPLEVDEVVRGSIRITVSRPTSPSLRREDSALPAYARHMARFALVFILILTACASNPPGPSATPTVAAVPTASATVPAIPGGGIYTAGLGTLKGQWAFVIRKDRRRQVPTADRPAVAEVWALPLDGGQPRLAVRYVSEFDGRMGDVNVLRRQLSPDGRRLVLNVAAPRDSGGWRMTLMTVDLETGRTTALGRDNADHDRYPAWSRDGARIAYVRRPNFDLFDDGLWLMNVDGTAPRQMLPGALNSATYLYGWTPDGRGIGYVQVSEQAGYSVVDVATGAKAAFTGYLEFLAAEPFAWRSRGSPAFAATFATAPKEAEHQLEVADRPGGPQRVVATEPDRSLTLLAPRWHPSLDHILYVRASAGVGIGRRELFYIDLADNSKKAIPTAVGPFRADWFPAGNDIVYLAIANNAFSGGPVRYMRRDGTNDREIFQPPGDDAIFTDLTTFAYR